MSSDMRSAIECDGRRTPSAPDIAEGFGKQRQSKRESRRYPSMALGSADEMRVWSRHCLDLEYAEVMLVN